MNLKNYKLNLLNKFIKWAEIEYDEVTKQYSIINYKTPWVYWLWDTKEHALEEYLLWLKDMILVNKYETNEVMSIK